MQDSNEKLDASNKSYHNSLERQFITQTHFKTQIWDASHNIRLFRLLL